MNKSINKKRERFGKEAKDEWSKDLAKYFKVVKKCKKCGILYGLDREEQPQFLNLCPFCEANKK